MSATSPIPIKAAFIELSSTEFKSNCTFVNVPGDPDSHVGHNSKARDCGSRPGPCGADSGRGGFRRTLRPRAGCVQPVHPLGPGGCPPGRAGFLSFFLLAEQTHGGTDDLVRGGEASAPHLGLDELFKVCGQVSVHSGDRENPKRQDPETWRRWFAIKRNDMWRDLLAERHRTESDDKPSDPGSCAIHRQYQPDAPARGRIAPPRVTHGNPRWRFIGLELEPARVGAVDCG